MVKISIKVFAFAWVLCFTQHTFAQLSDNFSDGDFSSNPAWNGDAGEFMVNASQQLQLNAAAAGTSFLSTTSNVPSLDNTEWQFFIHLNFSPSSANYARIYLASNQNNLEGNLNGYYLQFGETGSNDAIELFRQTGGASASVARGTNAFIASAFTISVKVTRDAAGLWSLYADPAAGTNFVLQASGTDNTFTSSQYFGVVCTYTISNVANFFFDDFTFPHTPDVIGPYISQVAAVSSTQLDVKFSETVELISSETENNYSVDNGIGNPQLVIRDVTDASLVHLTFSTNFSDGVLNTLTVNAVSDLAGNLIAANTTAVFTWFAPVIAGPLDVIINEILFAPFSGHHEFVELYNRSGKTINLKDLKIADASLEDSVVIAPAGYLLLPGHYVVITEDSMDVCLQYSCLQEGVFIQSSSLPSFNNDEDDIVIIGNGGIEIDRFHYSEEYHFALLQDPTGVSLERINSERITQDSTNWHSASQSAGFATPGYKNSQGMDGSGSSDEIHVTPEIFSPDNDGNNDVVSIEYNFSTPGFVANVTIYDAKGRKVRRLVNNELLGLKGAFSWDGINDDHEKAATGIYVIFAEVFNAEGKVKDFKKTCVLATKL